jgi:glucose-1-phosphate adenylyltransferase
MSYTGRQTINTSNVLSVIMGGGQGTRLFPLTKERAKPAVPLAGKYRLVDIPISNCINSGLRRIYLLTQFNSASLHRHIAQSYKFDHFSGGFVEILAAEQTYTDASCYRMDFRAIMTEHAEAKADITIATIPVERQAAKSLGILQIDEDRRISRFAEKPKDPAVLDSLRLHPEWHQKLNISGGGELFLASMGIYVFNRDVIRRLLDNTLTDFGKDIIPQAIQNERVFSHVFQGYWEDIGTIRAFFEANLDITNELPRFNFFDMAAPIFSRPRFLPGSKINGAQIDHAVISDGCILNSANIRHSIIGLRCIVGSGTVMDRVIMLGSDYYESQESIESNGHAGKPRIGVGMNSRVENTIVDKNARIGNNVVITPAGKPENVDHPLYYIRDGIVIIPKNGVIPDGTVI